MKRDLLSSTGARLIRIAPGSFIMGSPENEAGRAYWERQREVSLPYEFYLGATPVTQRQYEAVITCPKYASCSWAAGNPADHPTARDVPVDSVGWRGAVEFCARLTQIDRDAGILSHDWEYRLPTEAEWEYACRAGTSGSTYGPLDSIAWHRHQRIIRILVERGADTRGARNLAEQGLAGRFEDLPPPEAYREIIELLRDLGVE